MSRAKLNIVYMSHPDHREPFFLIGVVGQGVTGVYSNFLFLCGVPVYYFYVGDLYDSQLEAAIMGINIGSYRCL